MASSPTPRDELDEKLKQLDLEFLHGVPVHLTDEMIELIKQAFKDAGYMTGQEWYDRFMAEYLKAYQENRTASGDTLAAKAQTAAKRASGIQD